MSEKTYYPRNRDVILNRAKDRYENVKKTKRENMEKTDTIRCLKKRNKD